MATEVHQRCRFPGCEIHRGKPWPRNFSARNYAQMREDRAAGLTHADIARWFGTTRATVYAALRRSRIPRR